MACLSGAGCNGWQVSLGEFAVKECQDDSIKAIGQFRIVPRTFVAHKRVSAVDLVPIEAQAKLVEASENLHATLKRDVRILPSPDHEQFATDVFSALDRVVVLALAKAALMHIRGIETGGAQYIGVHCGAEGEVTSDADTERAEFPCAVGPRRQVIERGACVGVVAGQLLSCL